MSPEEFEAAVSAAIEGMPEWVHDKIDNLVIVVAEAPDPEHGDLLGLYEGISLLDRSSDYYGALPDQITIYRKPHLALGLDRLETEREVRRTVLHEVAHHLGIDDDRLHELGWD